MQKQLKSLLILKIGFENFWKSFCHTRSDYDKSSMMWEHNTAVNILSQRGAEKTRDTLI
jgi:aconitase B